MVNIRYVKNLAVQSFMCVPTGAISSSDCLSKVYPLVAVLGIVADGKALQSFVLDFPWLFAGVLQVVVGFPYAHIEVVVKFFRMFSKMLVLRFWFSYFF